MQQQLITLKTSVQVLLDRPTFRQPGSKPETFVARVSVMRVLCKDDRSLDVNVRAVTLGDNDINLNELREGLGGAFPLTLNPANILSRQILAYNIDICGKCKAENRIVNECRCDPNNLPTVVESFESLDVL